MSRLFTNSPIDPRRLNQLPHEIARQTHGERRRIHGEIVPMRSFGRFDAFLAFADRFVSRFALAVAIFTAAYFAAQLARPFVERIFS